MESQTHDSVKNQPVMSVGSGFPKLCGSCGRSTGDRNRRTRFCRPCRQERERAYSREYRRRCPIAVKAHYAVQLEIQRGNLPKADELKCTDCDRNANCYDHRDYTKPLEVDPVCGGCNKRRGPAHPYINANLRLSIGIEPEWKP